MTWPSQGFPTSLMLSLAAITPSLYAKRRCATTRPLGGRHVSTGIEVCKQRLVEERHLFGRRHLECFGPLEQCISFYGRLLQTSALNPLKEHICWRRDIMQLNGSTKGSGSEPQGIPSKSTSVGAER